MDSAESIIGTRCAVCGLSDDLHGCDNDSYCCPTEPHRVEKTAESLKTDEKAPNDDK